MAGCPAAAGRKELKSMITEPALSSRWLAALLVACAVESVIAVILRLHDVAQLVSGDATLTTITAGVGLVWLVVLFVAIAGALRVMAAARRRLAFTETVVAGIASTSRDWVWEADRNLRLTYCSPRVAEQLGYSSEQLLGTDLPSLMADASAVEAQGIVADAIVRKHGWRDVERDWRHVAGHTVTLRESGEPIVDRDGHVVGFRGSCHVVTEAMAVERAVIATRSRVLEVVNDGALETALQPIVDVATGRLRGAEALARFHDGRGPQFWFDEARECGASLALDRVSFDCHLEALRNLPGDAYLSVNATPELICDARWPEKLMAGSHDLERLVVEITEHVEIHRYDELNAALLPLRERGLRLAIDDTGAGYASFSHVLQLNPDIIKIDRSLIGRIANDPARRSLVTALVLLALDLGATVTAEGVETSPEYEALAVLGVDNAQGFLLGKPTTDVARWRAWADKTWTITRVEEPEPVRAVASDEAMPHFVRR